MDGFIKRERLDRCVQLVNEMRWTFKTINFLKIPLNLSGVTHVNQQSMK